MKRAGFLCFWLDRLKSEALVLLVIMASRPFSLIMILEVPYSKSNRVLASVTVKDILCFTFTIPLQNEAVDAEQARPQYFGASLAPGWIP